jgi:hypothetical protein
MKFVGALLLGQVLDLLVEVHHLRDIIAEVDVGDFGFGELLLDLLLQRLLAHILR